MLIKTDAPRISLHLSIAGLLVWLLICWWGTGIWRDRAATEVYDEAHQHVEQFLATSSADYERATTTRRGMIRVLAREPTYGDALSRHSPWVATGDEDERRRLWNADPRLAAVSRQLAIAARDFGMRSIWLMDSNGNCIASSNAGESRDHVGTRYADRDYFQVALAGRSAYQVNIGRRQLGASISFAAPVTDRDGRVIGVLAGGNELSTVTNRFDQGEAFFTDRHGVVVLAKDHTMLLHTLPHAPAQTFDSATRQSLYKTTELPVLSLPGQREGHRVEPLRNTDGTTPIIFSSHSLADGELVVHALQPLPQLADLWLRRTIYAGTFAVIGSLFVLLATAAVLYRRQRRAFVLDLAEREHRVAQARDFLDQIVNAIADPVFVTDHEHRWVLVNQAFCEIHGQPRANFIGKSAHEVFSESVAQRMWDVDERVLAADVERVAEEKLTDRQGVTRVVVTKKTPYTDVMGRRLIVGIISDITERKRVERLIRAREREFHSLAENLPLAVIRYDSECRRTYLNSMAQRMLYGTTTELLGLVPGGGGVPASSAMIAYYRGKMEDVLATDSARELDFVLDALPVDQQKHFEVRFVSEHGAEGKTTGVLAIWYDITERKRLENALKQRETEFRALAENLPDPVFRYDRDCRRVYVNPAALRVTGMTAEQLLGSVPTSSATITSEVAANIIAAIREVVATGERRSFHIGYINSDGSVSDHQGLLVPEFDANGQVATVLTMVHDVTSMRRAERHAASFFANMPGFAYTLRLSTDGRASLPFASSGIETIYGLRPEEVLSDASLMHALEHPEDLSRIQAASALAAQTLEPLQIEFRVLRPGYPERWIESRSMPERQAGGGVLWHGIMLDITERKHAEQRLREALEFSNGVINAIPDLLFEVDRAGRYLNVWTQNPNVQAAQKSELLGKTIYDVLTSENAATTMQALIEADAKGSSFGKAIRIAQPGGETRWYEPSIARKFCQTSSDVTFLVLSRDVTKKIDAQQRLDETRKRLLSVLQTMPDMVWLKDMNGVYQLCNHAFSRLTGISESEMFGRTDYDLFDAGLADFFRQQDRTAIEAGTVRLNEEWVNYADDGHRALLETRKVPVYDVDGKLTGVLGIARDVTERKEAELALRASEAHIQSRNELLHAIVESSPEIIIFALDTAYRYLAFNRKHRVTMQAIWGKDIGIGMDMLDVIGDHPDRLVAQTSMDRALAGESFMLEETYGGELLSRQHWLNHWAPIRSETGDVVGLTCFVLNISERRTAEEHLRRSRDIVRALAAHQETEREKERRRLAYEIHEDLAQNFAALRLHLASLEMGDVDTKHAQLLHTMQGIADHSIARIRAMVSMLRPAVLDLGLVSALQWLTDDFKGVGLDFVLALQDEIVLSDVLTTFLYRAAKEALLNVALHAAATQVSVSLVADEGVCKLVVRDNGCGFDSVAKYREGRFGLIGLAEGALHLGGELCVNSTPGRGTTLEIRTPIPHFSST